MNTDQTNTISKYDRIYGGLHDVSLPTKPSTIKVVQNLTGESETFVVQTFRHEEMGDYLFIEHLSKEGVVRLALPPKVTDVIASQRDSLTKRRRSTASKRAMAARMATGWKPSFKKSKKK